MNPEPLTMNHNSGFPTPQKDYYKVYVRSITFNQAPYIEDCLNGVAMQETSFPFVHHVIDDASTDGEQDVIKAWMDKNCDMEHAEYYDNDICTITIVKNKKNPNCTLAAYFLKKNMYGNPKKVELFTPWREVCPYEALCEGDDYWIDPNKLQKQVDWLDEHEGFGLVYTKVKRYEQTSRQFKGEWGKKCDFKYLLFHGSPIPTLSTCYRTNILLEYSKSITNDPKWPLGDVPLWLYFMRYSKIHFMDEIMGVYRVLQYSASHDRNPAKVIIFNDGAHMCRAFYAKRYGWDELVKPIHEYRLTIVANDCIGFGMKSPTPLIRDCIRYKVTSPYIWTRCIIASTPLVKLLYNLKFQR